MRLLLINNNPAVSRLINLSAEKFGYEIEEFKGDDFDLNENFDITIADNEAVSDNSMLLLRESGTLGEIIYIGPKGLPKPIYANYFLQKPFLPTDFIDLVKKIEKLSKKDKVVKSDTDTEDSNTFIDDTEPENTNKEEEGIVALDLDDMDSLDLPMPDDDFMVYEEEKLKDEISKADESFEKEELKDDSDEDSDIQETELKEDTEEQEAEVLSESLESEEEESEKEESDIDIPKELKLEEDENDKEDGTAILDSEDIDEVKQLLDDDMVADESDEDESVKDESDEDIKDNESDEIEQNENEEAKDVGDDFDIEEDILIGETNIEDAMDDISNEDEVLGGLIQESEELEEPADILKEIENIDEESSVLEDDEAVESVEMSESEEIEDAVPPASIEKKDSIDDISEEDLEGLFSESEEDTSINIDELKEELQTKIVSDVKKALDKDEIREALKGLKVNISISFNEE